MQTEELGQGEVGTRQRSQTEELGQGAVGTRQCSQTEELGHGGVGTRQCRLKSWDRERLGQDSAVRLKSWDMDEGVGTRQYSQCAGGVPSGLSVSTLIAWPPFRKA